MTSRPPPFENRCFRLWVGCDLPYIGVHNLVDRVRFSNGGRDKFWTRPTLDQAPTKRAQICIFLEARLAAIYHTFRSGETEARARSCCRLLRAPGASASVTAGLPVSLSPPTRAAVPLQTAPALGSARLLLLGHRRTIFWAMSVFTCRLYRLD